MTDVRTRYAITISLNGAPTVADYTPYIQRCQSIGSVSEVNFETGAQGRKHVHFTWETAADTGRRHRILYRRGRGTYCCKEIFAEKGWSIYINKDRERDEESDSYLEEKNSLKVYLIKRLV